MDRGLLPHTVGRIYESGKTPCTAKIYARNCTEECIATEPQKTPGYRHVYDSPFKQRTTYKHQHTHGTTSRAPHNKGTPLILSVEARVARMHISYNITGAPTHYPTSTHPPTLATHLASHKNITPQAHTTNHNTPPHTHGIAAGDIYTSPTSTPCTPSYPYYPANPLTGMDIGTNTTHQPHYDPCTTHPTTPSVP